MPLTATALIVAAMMLDLAACGSFERSTEKEVSRAFFIVFIALVCAFFAGRLLP